MESSKNAFLKISLKYGLITGCLMILFNILIYVFNVNMFSIVFGLLSFVVIFGLLITFMVISMNEYKRKILGGKISYWQCFFTGLVLAIVAMWLSGIYSYLFYGFFDTDYMPKQVDKFAEMMQGYGLAEDKIQEKIIDMQEKMKPLKQFITNLYTVPIISAIVSFIISAFIKKNDDALSTKDL